MNDQTPTSGKPTGPELPALSQASIDRIEQSVFVDIADERVPRSAPATSRSRRRGVLTGAGIAAAFVAGVLITPPILSTVESSVSGSAIVEAVSESADRAVPEIIDGSSSIPGTAIDSTEREIIANAQATVRVDDVSVAVEKVAAVAEKSGGYVESTDISADPMDVDMSVSVQPGPGHGWISIRVPSADLAGVIDALGDTGVVVSSSISKQDVTSTAIDLRARVDATRSSVERLTELMSQSGSVADLIEAEVALTDRQAQLESYEQQLTALEDQVAMSSLQVQLTPEAAATTPEPDGFGAGLIAGWNGLIVSLNALVVTAGFLLPWLVVAGLVLLVVVMIRRRRRRTRETRQDT